MKKWICFVMTGILCAMALTACGNGQQNNADVQEQTAAEDAQADVVEWLSGLGY